MTAAMRAHNDSSNAPMCAQVSVRSQAGWTLKVEKNRVRFDITLFRILEVMTRGGSVGAGHRVSRRGAQGQ
jgi:hypothetical protein